MNNIFLCAFILCVFSQFAAADNFTLIGKAQDSGAKPIELGNVIALSIKDSAILKGDVFMSGQFKLIGLSENDFILKITAIGFSDYFQSIRKSNADSVLDIGTINLTINANLKQVEVVSKLPMFENDGEKVKVNVESSALSSAGTVLDVLKKSPTVMIDNSDNISIFGKGNAVVYIDGQQISSNDILKTIQSSEIKEIEIIANPSAKYDAAGKAVINIITKKNNLEGYNGNVIQNQLYGHDLFTYTGLRFNYKRKKWSTFISYGLPHGKGWKYDEYYRNVQSNDTTKLEMKNKITTIDNQVNSHNYRAGITYFIDSTKSIGIQYNGFYEKNKNNIENVNDVFVNTIPQVTIGTTTLAEPVMINNTGNINFTKKLDTLQSEFSITAQYGNFISKNLETINQSIIIGNSSNQQIKRNTGLNNIQLFTGQSDLTSAFNNKWKLESGVKGSYVINESKINFENKNSAGEWIADTAIENGYKYDESILAGYSQFHFTTTKVHFRAGVRAEYTQSNGFSKITNARLIGREYFNVFPNAYFGYDFTKDLTTSVTYSSRITRPSFQDMNPFTNYIDSLSSFRGNPNLQPAYTNEFEASLIYMKEASLTFTYSKTNGAMNLVVDKLNDGTDAFVATNKNLDYSETYSVGITIPYELKWWTTYNYFGYMENTFSYNSVGTIINNRKPMMYMYLYDEFRFKKYFSTEITFEYTGAGVDGIFTFEPFYNLSANIKKTFFKDKLTARFIANDILSTAFNTGDSNVQGYDVHYTSKENTHYFVLALNWRFGKLKNYDYKDKTVNQEEYDRIKVAK